MRIHALEFDTNTSPAEIGQGGGWSHELARQWLRSQPGLRAGFSSQNRDGRLYYPQGDAGVEFAADQLPAGVTIAPSPAERTAAVSGFLERRTRFEGTELRVAGTEKAPEISGYAAIFDEPAELWPGLKEIVRPGAFSRALEERQDVLGLFEHSQLLARSSAGSLDLWEDSKGLGYTMRPRRAQWIEEDVLEPIRRGEIRGSSFGFRPRTAPETVDGEGEVTRELLDVDLHDVSPVTIPAYQGTEVAVRALQADGADYVSALRRSGLTEPEIRSNLEAALEQTRPRSSEPPTVDASIKEDLAARRAVLEKITTGR